MRADALTDQRLSVLRAIVYEAALGAVLVVGLLAAALALAPPGDLLPEWVQGPGLALLVAGGALWLWATVVLVARGGGTPLPLDPPRRLVTGGPYRFLRNPMHAGLAGFMVGEALLFRSGTFLAIVAVGVAGLVVWVRWREEPALARRFGAEHARWRARVPAWRPRIRLPRSAR